MGKEWFDIITIVLASSTITGGVTYGIGWWFKTRRADRLAEEQRWRNELKAANDRSDKYQLKVEGLLMDAIAEARDRGMRLVERAEIDKKQADVQSVTALALTEAARAMAELRKVLADRTPPRG